MEVLVAWLTATIPTFLLVFARTAGLFLQVPVFSSRVLPGPVRVALMVAISILAMFVMPSYARVPNMMFAFILLLMQEILVGGLLGFAASFVFLAVQSAGELAGVQSGLSAASVMNPFTRSNVNAFGTLFFNLALLVFLVTGGHLWMLGAYVQSFRLVPLGTFVLTTDVANQLILMSGAFLTITIQLALPVITVVMLADLGVGYMSKVSPQASSLTQDLVTISKPVAGMLLVIALMPNLMTLTYQHTEKMIADLEALLKASRTSQVR
ncbi:MAG: flagellar biosynthetic protein FliR [Candidatus Sericytochromatia bacterium]|nr:flagellar biosynthetic protein FliR [Candidatus Sericytochromatia bacterium]